MIKYIKQTRERFPYKTTEITKEELITLIGKDRLEEILNNMTLRSIGAGVLVEVTPTYYGTSDEWAGVQF